MTTRLVLDKFDFNLAALTTWLVIIVVVVITSSTHTGALAVDIGTVAHLLQLVLRGRGVLIDNIGGKISHGDGGKWDQGLDWESEN